MAESKPYYRSGATDTRRAPAMSVSASPRTPSANGSASFGPCLGVGWRRRPDVNRRMEVLLIPCDVIAPAWIRRRPGDRIKTDRRDAGRLAVLHRTGALTAISIPTEQEEAARALLRCREDLRADLLRARHRLSTFLLRHGRRFTATRAWSKQHDVWLRVQATFTVPASRATCLPPCRSAVASAAARRPRAAGIAA